MACRTPDVAGEAFVWERLGGVFLRHLTDAGANSGTGASNATGNGYADPVEALTSVPFGIGAVLVGERRRLERIGLGLEGIVSAADQLEGVGKEFSGNQPVAFKRQLPATRRRFISGRMRPSVA